MLAFMKDIKDCDLEPLVKPEDMKRAKEIFREIVTMIKYMGSFFARLLLFINTGSTNVKFSSEYHTLSLLMSTMLVPHYIFQRYCFFLAKILTIQDQREWFEWRREKVKEKSTSSNMIYLNKFIGVEEKRNLIRKNTIRRMSSARFVQRREIGFHQVNGIKMDMNEFLSHLQLQVNLELDDVFSTDLKGIIEFFKTLDEFVNNTFYNAELEIKIDLMQLILRMTTATKFVTYIYVLSNMKANFLDECQIFALFCQVLLSELKKPAQEKAKKKENLETSRVAFTTTPIRTRLNSGHYLVPNESSGRDKTTSYDLNNQSGDKKHQGLMRLNISDANSKHNDSLPHISIKELSCDSELISPGMRGRRQPTPSVFRPIIKQLDRDSICSSHIREESSEIDLEQDSGEVSETSPKRRHDQAYLSKFKFRNSCSPEPRMLKRLSHVNTIGSQDCIASSHRSVEGDEDSQEMPQVALFNPQ